MEFLKNLEKLLTKQKGLIIDLERSSLIENAVTDKEAFISKNGALSVLTPPESTGRSPKDTYLVKREEIVNEIDWDSPNNIPMAPDTFQMILDDVLEVLGKKEKLYITNRALGADSSYSLQIRTITDRAITALFTDNMFRPIPDNIQKSVFNKQNFTLIGIPYHKLDSSKYLDRLRKYPDGQTSNMAVVVDLVNRIGVVFGSAYMGSIKKLMFTVMNYMLPEAGILPIHTSANESKDGSISLFLGLSGTGKTTLSADPERALLGDDEHGWNDNGIANFENGCYAKLIDLDPEKEPEINNAIMHSDNYQNHGAIVENAFMYPDGRFDFFDPRLTENSRGSFPLKFLSNIKESSTGDHPKAILFLTADANSVLPPVAKLTENQAMLWFIMGYTSKLAGTETGIKNPVSTFSRFFGEPFMPRNPDVYASLLGEKLRQHKTSVFLINTGWVGGPYGIGKRIDIDLTRSIVNTVIDSRLENCDFTEDKLFHFLVPRTLPGIDPKILQPRESWEDKEAFDKRAKQLAMDFSRHFDKAYGNRNLSPEIIKNCPGKK